MAKPIADGRFGLLDLKKIRELSSGAFEAGVYFDGKEIGYVTNSGTGGCNDWSLFGDEATKSLDACLDHYREWCERNGQRTDFHEWEDIVIEAIIEYKDDQKFAKTAKRQGKTFAAKVSQSDKSQKATGKYAAVYSYSGSFDGEPQSVADQLVEALANDEAEVARSVHDQVEVLMANGEVFAAPVVIPVKFPAPVS